MTLYAAVLVVILAACGQHNSPAQQKNAAADTPVTARTADTSHTPPDIDTNDFAIMYLTIADTSQNYHELDSEMYALSKALKTPIDTMNRYYNKHKHEIVLSEKDDDEIYRGEYFPRRSSSASLSLEYYKYYCDTSTQNNIALVAGMYESKSSADSLCRLLAPFARHSFTLQARIYMGCMH